jgi:diacylglycerol kinase family enzyme
MRDMLATMSRGVLIVNPFASGVTEERTAAVERSLSRVAAMEVVRTEQRGHATELARDADADALFVFSGDGGFNEVLNGRIDLPLGLIPGGATNVLPRALGLPRDPVAAAERLARALTQGRTRRISVGRVNGRRFGFAAGVGLDAELVRRVDARGRELGRRPGDTAFATAAMSLLARRRWRLEPVLEVVGFGRAAFALVANCDPYTYAGRVPLHVAPEARFELGLDVVAPNAVRPFAIPRLLAYAVRGRGQERAGDVLYGHDLDRLEIVGDALLPLQADGEDLGDAERVVVEAERGAATVLL